MLQSGGELFFVFCKLHIFLLQGVSRDFFAYVVSQKKRELQNFFSKA